jgi:hypothetical protein
MLLLVIVKNGGLVMKTVVLCSGVLLMVSTSATLGSTLVFSEDFEAGSPGIAGAGTVAGVQGFEGVGGISGNFWRNATDGSATTLSIGSLPSHSSITIEFDFAAIDSWDGANSIISGDGEVVAPDFFNVSLDGATILEKSFNNFAGTTPSAGVTELVGAAQDGTPPTGGDLGFSSSFFDSAFAVSLTVNHNGANAFFSFSGQGAGWQGGNDESWAIDNISVSVHPTPAPIPVPASLPLMLAGVAGLGFVAARRQSSK